MTIKDAKNRSPEIKQTDEGSESQGESGGLGAIPASGGESGAYKVRTSGEDSNKSDTFIERELPIGSITGKFVSQLIAETEKNLAYHKKQLAHHEQEINSLETRLQELKQISINDTE